MAEFKPSPQTVNPQPDNQLGCWILAILGLGAFIWIAGKGDPGTAPSNSASAYDANLAAPADTAATTPAAALLPLDPASAQRGYGQFRMVAAEHVPGSSEIFSRNCYEALSSTFDWHQLDRCGAYDALAVRWTEENENTAGEDDLSYFQSETAATRYLQAATRGGLPADQADTRWAALQAMALRVHLARAAPPPQSFDTSRSDDDLTSGDATTDLNAVAADETGDPGE